MAGQRDGQARAAGIDRFENLDQGLHAQVGLVGINAG